MVFNTENLSGLTVKHFWTDSEKINGKIVLYRDSLIVGYVTYEKEQNIKNLFTTEEYIKICKLNNITEIFPENQCYYISWIEVPQTEISKGYGNILMLEVLKHCDNEEFSKLFIVNACPYLRQEETLQSNNLIPIDILVKFYKRFGFKTLLDLNQTQLMYRKVQ